MNVGGGSTCIETASCMRVGWNLDGCVQYWEIVGGQSIVQYNICLRTAKVNCGETWAMRKEKSVEGYGKTRVEI